MILSVHIISVLSRMDYDLVVWIHNHTLPHSTPVLQFISAATTYISISVALIILVLSLVKKSALLRKKFFMVVAVLIMVALVSQGLKSLIHRDRPFEKYPEIEKLSHAGGSSFPSGHTMEAFAMATILSLLFTQRWVKITATAWAFLVGYSRIALGVHYPGDVLAGIITGCLIAWLIHSAGRLFRPGRT